MIEPSIDFKIYWWLFALWHHSAVIVVPVYVLIMRKIKVIYIKTNLGKYIFNMWAIYFISLYLNQYYLTPKFNKMIINFEGGIMGFIGNVEYFILQLLILVPLYILIMKESEVKFTSKGWKVFYFLFYYIVNYTFITAYTYAFRRYYNY